MNNIFRPFLNNSSDKLNLIRYNTVGKNKFTYFDYTASGLGFRQIENRIHDVLETYANTHSKESSNAKATTNYFNTARTNLYKNLELDDSFTIIPTGCGATSAIKHFQELMGLYIPPASKKRLNIIVKKSRLPLIIVGPYEHHSNEVSYREALCEVKRVKLTKDGLIDLDDLKKILKKVHKKDPTREIIGSFCIASNVSGIITPYKKISKILRKYNAIVCFDAASSSAYMNVDSKLFDVMVTSPHKLLGGVGSSGLLVIKKDLINTKLSPTFAGGGTVEYVNKNTQIYQENIDERELAGTPGILQFIKTSLAYQLRNEIGFDFIKQRKDELLEYFLNELNQIPNVIIYGNKNEKNIGIVSFNIKDKDPYELCEKISNTHNIQTRAGCSCAGPYGHDLLKIKKYDKDDKPGWLRVSIHFSHTKEDIDNLILSLKDIK
ncbi:MAG: aminotransferase class V-fold PLP-dependent enzyme [Sulfurovum sp.]